MVVKLYTTELSPPVIATIMACEIFNVSFENVVVNLEDKQHMSPEFLSNPTEPMNMCTEPINNANVDHISPGLKQLEDMGRGLCPAKNPMKTIPVLEDDDLIIHDRKKIINSPNYGRGSPSGIYTDEVIYMGEVLQKYQVRVSRYMDVDELEGVPIHAILMYLADEYGTDETWYPKDHKTRALVNQKLFFDTTVLFPRLKNITYALVVERKPTTNKKWLDNMDEGYALMEAFLSKTAFIAND